MGWIWVGVVWMATPLPEIVGVESVIATRKGTGAPSSNTRHPPPTNMSNYRLPFMLYYLYVSSILSAVTLHTQIKATKIYQIARNNYN